MRDKTLEKKKQFKSILFMYEGDSEENYIKGILKEMNLRGSVQIDHENIGGGGYKTFLINFDKSKLHLDMVIIITDLDKYNSDTSDSKSSEKANLKELIKKLEAENIKNNIFLNNKNIEEWFCASFDTKLKAKEFTELLGYQNSVEHKGDKKIFDKIKKKNGCFNKAKTKFKESNLFYLKKNFTKGKLTEKNSTKIQSNFIYFKEYLELIINE